MGALTAFDLKPWIEKYNLKTYRETGTGEAVSLKHALNYPFEKMYTVDADEQWTTNAKSISDRVKCVNNLSTDAIDDDFDIDDNEPCLWFLDAHFLGGADFHKISYEESLRKFGWDSFPLYNELKIINARRLIGKDVIVIDDWILYDPNRDYETIKHGVVWKYSKLQEELGLETPSKPIIDLLSNTHNITISLQHQGYLVATPKEV